MKADNPITSVIQPLPKIHKQLDKPPGRHIVASIGLLTEKISTFLDFFIKSSLVSLPAYVRNSMDMMNTLKTMHNINGEMLMACFHVESLYKNIPHRGGLEGTLSSSTTH